MTLLATTMTVLMTTSSVPVGTLSSPRQAAVTRAALPPRKINHILVIDLENKGFSETFGPASPATYLNHTLRTKGLLLSNYYATGHASLDNYIAQVSGQAPTNATKADCILSGFDVVKPGTPFPPSSPFYGQVQGSGCVYPPSVVTIAGQLDARYPPDPVTHRAQWRAYEEDMGNNPVRDGGAPDASGGTDCAHPASGAKDGAVRGSPADQYATRHNPFVWFDSVVDDRSLCIANDVPLGVLDASGKPAGDGHLARDLKSAKTTPMFGFVTPNLCNDAHDSNCAGTDSSGSHSGGLASADQFLQHWMPLILSSPAYRQGTMLVVVTFDEADINPSDPTYASSCCGEQAGPNVAPDVSGNGTATSTTNGGGRVGALLLNSRYVARGTVDSKYSYNHYSALRSYEDLLGLTTGGADGHGHLGYAGSAGLRPFGTDVFVRR